MKNLMHQKQTSLIKQLILFQHNYLSKTSMRTFFKLFIFAFLLFQIRLNAQSVYVGKDLSVTGTATLYFSGDLTTTSTGAYTNNGTVELKGNITNGIASMPAGTGTTKLTGSSTQRIGGAQPFNANNLTINNSATHDSAVVIDLNLTVAGTFTHTDGILKTNTNKVIFNNGAVSTGASDSSFIYGLVEKIGNSAFTFPVGAGNHLRTAAISAPSSITDAYTCRYNYFSPLPLCSLLIGGGGINHISTTEYWVLTKTAGSFIPTITLSYQNLYSGGISDSADLRIAFLDTTINRWKNLGGIATGGLTDGNLLAEITTGWLGAFTLASSTTLNPLPVELIEFTATYNNFTKTVDLYWETANEINSDYFIVERSEDGKYWYPLLQTDAAGTSFTVKSYAANDPTPLGGINYYRLKEVDNNGVFFYSNIEHIISNQESASGVVYPNPALNNTILIFKADLNDDYIICIYDLNGQLVMHSIEPMVQGENQFRMDLKYLVPGDYMIKVQALNHANTKIIKITKAN